MKAAKLGATETEEKDLPNWLSSAYTSGNLSGSLQDTARAPEGCRCKSM